MSEASIHLKLLVSIWIVAISVSVAHATETNVQSLQLKHSLVVQETLARQDIVTSGTAHPESRDLGAGGGQDPHPFEDHSGLDYYLSMHSRIVSGQVSPILMYWPHLRAFSEGEVRLSSDTRPQCEIRHLTPANYQREQPADSSLVTRKSAT